MDFSMQLHRSMSSRVNYKSPKESPRKCFRKRRHNCQRNEYCICIPQLIGNFEFPRIWKELRINGQLVDGSVHCSDNTEFQIHRAILSAASSYFRALFTNSINRGQPERYEANVDAPGTVFEILLDYAYTGNCLINEKNVKELLKFGDQYDMLGVVQMCCKFLLDSLKPSNCLSILEFANQYFCQELVLKGRSYVMKNFCKIITESSEYVLLAKDDLIDLLSDDELNVKSEEIVFEAIIRWINFLLESRLCWFCDLLKCIRLGNLSSFIIKSLMTHPLLQKEQLDYFLNVIVELEQIIYFGNINLELPLFRPRLSHDILFAIGGWSAGSPTNFVETYDIRADRWLLSSDTDSIPRAYHGLCVINDMIYIIGGFNGSEYFNTVRKFSPVTRSWTECACMNYNRCYVSVVEYKGTIYAMGGYNGRLRMNLAEKYDPGKNQWEIIAAMQRARSDASAAVLKDKIYIVGGFNGQDVMSSAEVFDIRENQWSFIPRMNFARSGVSLVAYDNSLYALGGFDGHIRLATGEKYTPASTSNYWTEIPAMTTPRSNFATVILDDFIYVIGGFNGTATINIVEYYDPEINEWYEASPMNLNRSALSACVISNLPNFKEYSILVKNQLEQGQGAEIRQ